VSGRLDRLEDAFGELVARGERDRDLGGLAERYGDDPVGFVREVLGGEPWREQVRVMEALLGRPRVAWSGSNSLGKDWVAARLALWWVYARGGLVLVTGPTARQVEEVVMRREVARAFGRASLPGDLFTSALRLPGREEASILAATATEAGHLTGHHAERVFAILTEAQDVPDHAWEGLAASATGPEDRTLAVGNPLRPSGRFYGASKPGSGWAWVATSAFEHPNLREDSERWIPGGPSAEWVERMRRDYGDGPIFEARVEGRFPEQGLHGLIRGAWLDEAVRRRERRRRRGEPIGSMSPLRAGLDPSRYGSDATVVAIRRGAVLDELLVWEGGRSTTELLGELVPALEARGFARHVRGTLGANAYGRPVMVGRQARRGRIVVDAVGLGGPVADRLREDGFAVDEFNGSSRAGDPDRHLNRRAGAHWHLARELEAGRIDLPADEALREEALAVEFAVGAGGKVQVESKDDLRSRLGRSPDRLDAAVLAFAPGLRSDRKRTKVRSFSYGRLR